MYLVSGGFRRLIEPVAEFLNIPRENVFANRILFDRKGIEWTEKVLNGQKYVQQLCEHKASCSVGEKVD